MDASLENSVCTACQKSWLEDSVPEANLHCWASFSENNVFDYGLAGQYKLLSDKVFSKGDTLCNQCLKTFKSKVHLSVSCSLCQKSHQSLFGQLGYGCDGDIYQNSICCGFGSKYDMLFVEFVQNSSESFKLPDNLKNGDIICDLCIDQYLKSGICRIPDSNTDSTVSIQPSGLSDPKTDSTVSI